MEYFFDYSLSESILEEELLVTFDYDLTNYVEEDFLVKPISTTPIYINNTYIRDWISAPTLKKEMHFISNFNNKNFIELSFVIKNKKTAEEFLTPTYFFPTRLYTAKYLNNVNTTLSKVSEQNEIPSINVWGLSSLYVLGLIPLVSISVIFFYMRKYAYAKKVDSFNSSNDVNISSFINSWQSNK